MAISNFTLLVAILLITISSGPWLSECTNFTIVNHCKETIWPGIIPSENISSTGSDLKPGLSTVFTAPPGWHGRIWGRTGCSFDTSNNGTCQTGGCGTSLNCSGPMIVTPIHGTGNCSTVGCDGDLRDHCPSELVVKFDGKTIACQSACDYFKTDEYCCRGQFEIPGSCQATNYSKIFKKVCPAAYSYAYDAPTSIFTCSNVSEYTVTFCASRNQTVFSRSAARLQKVIRVKDGNRSTSSDMVDHDAYTNSNV